MNLPDNLPAQLFPDEVWVPVTENVLTNIQPWYAVSNYGRVFNFKDSRFIVPTEATNHLYCHFRAFENGKSLDKHKTLQRVMMISFNYFPGCENYEVDHIDECSYNNQLFNMQWLTREQNIFKFHNSYYNRYINQLQQEKGNSGDFFIHYYNQDRLVVQPPILIHPCVFDPIPGSPYEVFAFVKGFGSRYVISNMGRIFDRLNGWFCVTFRIKGEKYLYCYEIKDYVPLAMMKAFNYVPGCENFSVNFKDGVTFNNYLPNLEWKMEDFNAEYGETANCGSNSYMSTVTEDEVRKACQLMQDTDLTYNEIAKIVGGNMSKSILTRIKLGNSWKHISKDFKFKSKTKTVYPPEIDQKAAEMIKQGFLLKDIAKELNIGYSGYLTRIKKKVLKGEL